MDYLKAIERCFPDAQAYITDGGDPTVYASLNWLTTPVSQNDIDTSPCVLSTFDNTSGEVVTTEYNVLDSGPIFTLSFNRENTSKNVWLSHEGDNSLPSDETPAIIPWNCKLVAITFTNQEDNADTDLQIHHAGAGAGSSNTLIHTWEIRNARIARKTVFAPDINFTAGDKIGIYLKDRGHDVKYTTVIVYLQISDSTTTDFTESFTGKFDV